MLIMLKAIKMLTEDLHNKERAFNKIHFKDKVVDTFAPYGINKNRLIHFYGEPDVGKTFIMKNIIENNEDKIFLYISNKLDDINKMNELNNVSILISNVFEELIEFLESLDKNLINVVIIDNFNNMLSKNELLSTFDTKLDNKNYIEKYIKRITKLAVEKKFIVFVINGINAVTEKSRYGYLIDKESIASIKIEKETLTPDYLRLKIINERNLISPNIKKEEKLKLYF